MILAGSFSGYLYRIMLAGIVTDERRRSIRFYLPGTTVVYLRMRDQACCPVFAAYCISACNYAVLMIYDILQLEVFCDV